MMEFPRFVYKASGNLQRAGGSYSYEYILDESQYSAALKAGWFHSLDDAINNVVLTIPNDEKELPPTRDELETKAKELGLKFDGRTSDAKLNIMIETALGAK